MAGRRFLQIILGVVLGYIVMSLIARALNGDQTINLTAVMSDKLGGMGRGINRLAGLHVKRSLTERPVRVMVMVLTGTQSKSWKKREAVRRTWGKRVKHIFISSKVNLTDPNTDDIFKKPRNDTVELNVPEGREHLTAKSFLGFRHMYENYLDDADWFMKADDDTYVIVENLRHFLSQRNTSEPTYFGQIFMMFFKQGYNSGGAGYVLSKEALTRMYHAGSKSEASACKQFRGSEDVKVGRCMVEVGVKIQETVDEKGRSRFHCFVPETHVLGGYLDWYPRYDKYHANASISPSAITFHYVDPRLMTMMELYLYRLKVHGE